MRLWAWRPIGPTSRPISPICIALGSAASSLTPYSSFLELETADHKKVVLIKNSRIVRPLQLPNGRKSALSQGC